MAGIGEWFKRNYDRILASVSLLLLLVSLVSLAVYAQVQKQAQSRFDEELGSLKPAHEQAGPADVAVFADAGEKLAHPLQADEWALKLFVPQLRVKCVNCSRPIPYVATNCTFTQCGAVQPPDPKEIKDKDHDGMLDAWEEKYQFNPLDPDDATADPDADGFVNREEYEFQTNPREAKDHPPALAKLTVAEIQPIPFRMIFKAASRAGEKYIFQINLRTGARTYWKSLGDDVEGFKVAAYDPKAAEGPTLILERDGRQIPLIKGREVPRDEYQVKLASALDASVITTRVDAEFDVKGAKYTVKKVDMQAGRVLINDPSRGVDVWIGRSGGL